MITKVFYCFYLLAVLGGTSAFIFGILALVQPEKIFGWLGAIIAERLPEKVSFPLCFCAPCMASVYGTISFWLFIASEFSWWWWPVFCITLAGLNYILANLFSVDEIHVRNHY